MAILGNYIVDSGQGDEDDEGDGEGFFDTLLDYCPGSVALLQAYFDESERANGLLCVAGYVFGPQQARKLTREFREVFGCYGGFHMKDLTARRKGFRGISEDEQARLVKAAVDIVKVRFRYGITVSVAIEEYESLAPKWIRGFKKPYPFLCHLAMTGVSENI